MLSAAEHQRALSFERSWWKVNWETKSWWTIRFLHNLVLSHSMNEIEPNVNVLKDLMDVNY